MSEGSRVEQQRKGVVSMTSLRSLGSRTFGLNLGRHEDHDDGSSSESSDSDFGPRSHMDEGSFRGVASTSSVGESLGGSLSVSRMPLYKSASLTPSASGHASGSLPPFEQFIEHQLDRVREQFESNRSRAVGGTPAEVLQDMEHLQKKQQDILVRHVELEKSGPVGALGKLSDLPKEKIKETMFSRDEQAKAIVLDLRILSDDIQALSEKIESSKIGTETHVWRPEDPVELSEEDSGDEYSSIDFQSPRDDSF
ncbi:hypothetical protein NDN08_005465 [Rhodosorus marinus]|uniref:Uncharacterized protein n=1 Tax=Rhodosorus marinus TaxID=101924 RepID=A0AAV8V1N0_9RHOD|nr:hypothetical protein NDN08_005465 [Rhodosorus marinus]